MPVLLGPFDPLKLHFNVLNLLMERGLITVDEVKAALRESIDPRLAEVEKEKILQSMFIKRGNGP